MTVGPEPGGGPAANSGVMVVVMVVVVMMMRPVSQRRTCEHRQQEYCRKNLLHGTNPNMVLVPCPGVHVTNVPGEKRRRRWGAKHARSIED